MIGGDIFVGESKLLYSAASTNELDNVTDLREDFRVVAGDTEGLCMMFLSRSSSKKARFNLISLLRRPHRSVSVVCAFGC